MRGGKETILMISNHACVRVLKEAIALKVKGYQVGVLASVIPMGRSFYDSVSIYSGPRELACAIGMSNADILHVHNEPDWMVTVAKENSGGRPVVFDVHDLDSLRGKGIQPEEVSAFNAADAVVHVSDKCKESAETSHASIKNKPSTVLFSYVNECFVADDSMIVKNPSFDSVVYEGGVNADQSPKKLTDNEKATCTNPNDQLSVNLRYLVDIVKAFRCYEYAVNIYPPIDPGNLLYESLGAFVSKPLIYPNMLTAIRPHGLGIVGAAYISDLMNAAMPNKLFEYMSQGVVPVCINANEASKFIKDNDCGITLTSFNNVRGDLKEAPDKRANVLKLRKELTMESQIYKLIELYNQLKS